MEKEIYPQNFPPQIERTNKLPIFGHCICFCSVSNSLNLKNELERKLVNFVYQATIDIALLKLSITVHCYQVQNVTNVLTTEKIAENAKQNNLRFVC